MGAVLGAEFADVGEAIPQAVVGAVQGTTGDVFEHQVVDRDVERLGDAGHDIE